MVMLPSMPFVLLPYLLGAASEAGSQVITPDDGNAAGVLPVPQFAPLPAVASGIELERRLAAAIERLRPLQAPIEPPGTHDWLANHPETGQTFQQFLAARPTRLRAKANVIYIQPLGEFTPAHRRIVATTADFLALFFNLPVKTAADLALSLVPADARRRHPAWGMEQVLTGYVLDSLLKPRLPAEACAYIAFTTADLWPGAGWNFVFGQASLRERVGVWSMYRYGDPDGGTAAYNLCLLRTMKVASHEVGHMFSLLHCTAFQCGMCGSNHLAESDRRPLWFCQECMAKICWFTGCEPAARYLRLAEFMGRRGFERERRFYERAATLLEATSGR